MSGGKIFRSRMSLIHFGTASFQSDVHTRGRAAERYQEIINLPSSITHVPGTRSWMVGIANIRGNLLPITDLQVYLGGKPIAIGKRSQVLVIEHDEARMGLLVGGVQELSISSRISGSLIMQYPEPG